MIEKDEGSGRLTSLSDDRFEMAVEYSITFRRELRNVQPGLQPVADLTTTVHYIRSIGGREIPTGEYLLIKRGDKVNRVKKLVGWHVLSWPHG